MKKRTILGLLVAIILIMATSCLFKIRRKDCVKVFYKRIARTSSYAQAMPGNYKYVDYASLARDFDALILGGRPRPQNFRYFGQIRPIKPSEFRPMLGTTVPVKTGNRKR